MNALRNKSGSSNWGMGLIGQFVILVLLAVLVGGLNGFLNPNTPAWDPGELGEGEVSLAMVGSWEEPILWIDARSEAAYGEDHIPGAVLLNIDRFDELLPGFLDSWQGNEMVVVYCDSRQCGASEAVARRLREDMALEDVFVLKGGWSKWQEEKK